MPAMRPAAVAGQFYPADPRALRAQLHGYLADVAPRGAGAAQACPKLLVVPHAGTVYSGPVAAHAYAALAPCRDRITRVVLLGPVHRVPVAGLAAPTVAAFMTPLGAVPVDTQALAALRDLPQVAWDDAPHAPEHALEVQLPFLQSVLGSFRLVPLLVGDASPDAVAEVLERLWGGPETLIVISTDLSHYLPHAKAQVLDRATVQRITDLATDLRPDQACGARPLNGALLAARRHGLRPRLLDLRNSGDTAGDPARVVGYAALAFDPTFDPAPGAEKGACELDDVGAALLATARQAIAQRLGLPAPQPPAHPALAAPGACFVTLSDAQGRLRGCIGGLHVQGPLGEDVRHHARAAAFADPRFAPLRADEWPGLRVEVSVLDAPEPMTVRDEADALRQLRPGRDGVVLAWHGQRATFLPQVWEQFPEPAQFLAALKRKAGLAADFWAADLSLARYAVRRFHDDPGPAS